ncbi:Crp/Fnr family transcriptional regulator [Chryseobacterium wangxinyae]|uniref:Crp/Fnr family transcriptional regulator n=1 Tax=Chryseobacterium sp. CY353 TaxID=2997334 RepID=UPI00226D7D16|nr:Crp/Fnr family transcriptional regulator [Chryseobacterium sp. CY353]MCY0967879.1 Crp/Fnr family transcriptional regulator [Chryseobacterium sp. CY353]
MAIEETLLRNFNATEEHYNEGDVIFSESSVPEYYYQIVTGEVKLNSFSDKGKEFIQNIISGKSCFGESMLILGKPYPVNAVALSDCTVLKLASKEFFVLLRDHPGVFVDMYSRLADNTFEKQKLMRVITDPNPEERIIEIMELLKESHMNKEKFSLEIPHSKEQLASLTGLSLETAISAIDKMEQKNILKIQGEKIFY